MSDSKGKIPDHMYPFYRVYDEKGQQYCDCGWEEHAIELCILNEKCSLEADRKKLTYERIDAPKPIDPETVDVNAIIDKELPGQQGLPSATERLHADMKKGILEASEVEEFKV